MSRPELRVYGMHRGKIVEIGLILLSFIFVIWFFGKSFGFDDRAGTLWVARNQVADFGLHLSLIGSFSKGNNFPPESPFFPGVPLTYHFLFDMIAGLLVRGGTPITIAVNGLSAAGLLGIFYLLLRISQLVFGRSLRTGLLSILLFLSPGGWGFIDFFTSVSPSQWVTRWWRLPDFLHSGPFDGSVYSTYFSLNVILNQRHLILGMMLGLFIIRGALQKIYGQKMYSRKELIVGGILLGVLFWTHSLIAVSTAIIVGIVGAFGRRWKQLAVVGSLAFVVSLPRVLTILATAGPHTWINAGFLAVRPLTITSWISYWWLNTGLLVFLIPIGAYLAKPRQRILLFACIPLFVTANIFQFSYRIEHNHSIFNYFFLFGNLYAAWALDRIWQRNILGAAAALCITVLLAINGATQMTAIKNDYHFVIAEVQAPLMSWIEHNTERNSVFLAPATLMDPVTLSGRFNFVGASYYLQVMGYDPRMRQEQMKRYLENPSAETIKQMKRERISYILVPKKAMDDYPYSIDSKYYSEFTKTVYTDQHYTLYQL